MNSYLPDSQPEPPTGDSAAGQPPVQPSGPASELWGPWFAPTQHEQSNSVQPGAPGSLAVDPQATYQERVSGSSPTPSIPYTGNPYPPYPPYPPYSPYQQQRPYPPYQYYPPPRPKRDRYLFTVSIVSMIGSLLTVLGGLLALLSVLSISLVNSPTSPNAQLSADQQFMVTVTLLAFAIIGIVGGGYGVYHSIRAVRARKPSSAFKMHSYWLFVALYIIVIIAGFVLRGQGQANVPQSLTVALVLLAGLMPALAVMALGNRRLHAPGRTGETAGTAGKEAAAWPTSWRRFTLAIVSGATLGVLVAGVLEFVFQAALVRGQGVDPFLCLTNPYAPQCQDPALYNLLLIFVAVIAPLIEEAVKPLAAVILIGRIRSAAEAFVLGLACGIGFDLIETSGYISSTYPDWLSTALVRAGAGLPHGFGSAMIVLGWYYLTHPGKKRVLKALGCWLYAVLQHAVWNGSWGLVLLPGSAGQFFSNTLALGSLSLPYYTVINIAEALFMLYFFLYITRVLRGAN